jgi:hypothetical protein
MRAGSLKIILADFEVDPLPVPEIEPDALVDKLQRIGPLVVAVRPDHADLHHLVEEVLPARVSHPPWSRIILNRIRGPSESMSDVILKLVELEAKGEL